MANGIGRRELLGNLALAAAGVAGAQVLSACGGSSSDGTAAVKGGNCSSAGSKNMVTGPSSGGDGHTHTFIMSAAQINAADAGATFTTSLDFQHTHSVHLDAAQFTSLAGNQGIVTTTGAASDGDSHTHALTINCAG